MNHVWPDPPDRFQCSHPILVVLTAEWQVSPVRGEVRALRAVHYIRLPAKVSGHHETICPAVFKFFLRFKLPDDYFHVLYATPAITGRAARSVVVPRSTSAGKKRAELARAARSFAYLTESISPEIHRRRRDVAGAGGSKRN
jgi:hypothetical protein